MTINIYELEFKLLTTLDALADGAKLAPAARAAGVSAAYILHAIKKSEARHPDYSVSWRDEHARQFCELVPLAQRMGRIARDQRLRGVTVNGEQQFVLDPALLARFGDDADAKDMAELEGYQDFPFAHDISGNRIPLLSARFPRPQRQHRPNSPPRDAVSEQSSGADSEEGQSAAGKPQPEIGKHGLPKYESEWKPDPPPPYARGLRTPAPPPRVFISTPSSPRVAARPSRVAALNEQIARGVANPRPLDNMGRPTMPNSIYFIGKGVNDPPERTTGG
jgi:hypothetical protein